MVPAEPSREAVIPENEAVIRVREVFSRRRTVAVFGSIWKAERGPGLSGLGFTKNRGCKVAWRGGREHAEYIKEDLRRR
jgi:hypothetical protein